MNTYDRLQQTILGIAFILAPLLAFIGAMTFIFGIGVTSYGVASWVEGIFMALAFLLFVPTYLGLAKLLGERAPRLGIACAILGIGIGFGVIPSADRITQAALDQAGYEVPVFSLTHAGIAPIVIWMGLGMLVASVLLGIGFLRFGGIPRWSAVLLMIAPVVFIMGQGGNETIAWWRVNIAYPLSTVIWFLALAPVGIHLLNARTGEYAEDHLREAAV